MRILRVLFFLTVAAFSMLATTEASWAQCAPGQVNVADEASSVIDCRDVDADGNETGGGTVGGQSPEEIAAQQQRARENRGANALSWFYFSMGMNSQGQMGASATCITCDFITYFTLAIANFSAAVFVYFQGFFVVLAPLLFAGWIAIEAIKISVTGGAGGTRFFTGLIQKSALFFLAWGFLFNGFGMMGPSLPGQGAGTTYFAGPAWQVSGPALLEYSFALNNDVRTQTAQGLVGTGNTDMTPFQCNGLDARVSQLVNNQSLDPSIQAITQTACVVERMHSLGIATAIGLVTSAFYQGFESGLAFLGALFKAFFGVVLFAIYGISAVWLIFLLLDVVTKGLIVAAFLPLFGLAALFKPTRDVAVNALMQLIAVPIVALALGITSLLGFYLILGTITVYNNTYVMMSLAYNTTLQPIATGDMIPAFAEFIRRIQLDSSFQERIPADLLSPWIIYMIFVGISIFALGTKIVKMIESIMEIQGTSEMADTAKGMAITGAKFAAGAAFLGAKGAIAAAPMAGAAISGTGGGIKQLGGWAARKAMGRYNTFMGKT